MAQYIVGSWEKALKEEMPEIEVINKACPMLANVAEEGKANSEEGRRAIKEYMQIFKEKKICDIILGCTHYPIYEKIIKEEMGYDVNLINAGFAVSKYLQQFLNKDMEGNNKKPYQEIFFSKDKEENC